MQSKPWQTNPNFLLRNYTVALFEQERRLHFHQFEQAYIDNILD